MDQYDRILYALMADEAGGRRAEQLGASALDARDLGALDLGALSRRLAELTGRSFEIDGFEAAGSGHVNGTLLLDSRPERLVVKIQSDEVAVYRARPAFEPLVLQVLAAGGAPVPPVVAVDPDPATLGAPWFAMERVDALGVPDDALSGYMVDGWLAEVTAAERRQVFDTFVDCLARVHAVPVGGFRGFDRGGSHRRAIDYLRAAVEDAAPGRVPRQHRLLDVLEQRTPSGADDDIALCMGDARMANGLIRDAEVVALVDWEIAYLGNPAADIGYGINHVDWLTHTTGTRLDGIPTADETWDRWEARSGRVVAPDDRRYWVAFASMILTVTATRVIASFLGRPGDPEAEDVNTMLAWSEGLVDG